MMLSGDTDNGHGAKLPENPTNIALSGQNVLLINSYASEERFMEPGNVAIATLIISSLGLIGTLINSVYTAKTYNKNIWLEFLQRRDLLSQKISELNDRNTEAQLISAKYELVAVKKAGLPLRGEQAELNKEIITSIKKQREGIEYTIKRWGEKIEKLRFIHSNITLETDAHMVERMIDIVQEASDNVKTANNEYSATLYIYENTDEFIKTTLAEMDEKLRQINLDFERAIEKLTKSVN
jgi:hypothetical protein